MESHLRVQIVPRPSEPGFLARVGGAEFPIVDFAVQSEGGMFLSLVLAPDSLSIGDPPTAEVRPAAPQVASWGDGRVPDPRESIPGWTAEGISGQVAEHAERVTLRGFEASSRQPATSAFKRLVRLGNIGAAVTA